MIINDCLKESPDQSIVTTSPKGGLHIPIDFVENLLDDLTAQNWGTINFKPVLYEDLQKEQCGCGKPSSKNDDKYFIFSCAHVFPKSKFKSVRYHKMNFVERAFWGGCHSIMDDTSIERWKGFADWEKIKEIFFELAPLLTDEERANKFYSNLEKLIYEHQ